MFFPTLGLHKKKFNPEITGGASPVSVPISFDSGGSVLILSSSSITVPVIHELGGTTIVLSTSTVALPLTMGS